MGEYQPESLPKDRNDPEGFTEEKKKEETHKMAEANKAFAHFRY